MRIKAIMMLIGLFAVVAAFPLTYILSAEEVIIYVSDKEVTSKEGVKKYLVYTDGEVFENTDTVWFFKFNSSDVYGSLKEGEQYIVKVAGWRKPFFSWYRNIIKIEKEI